jgi:hypothetical protein
MEGVIKFIPETIAALTAIESSITGEKFKKLVNDKKDIISNRLVYFTFITGKECFLNICFRFTQADNYLKRDSYDSVTEMVEEAKAIIAELSDSQYSVV